MQNPLYSDSGRTVKIFHKNSRKTPETKGHPSFHRKKGHKKTAERFVLPFDLFLNEPFRKGM